jgi:hypothetical protein
MTDFLLWYSALPIYAQVLVWAIGILLVLAIVKRLVKLAVFMALLVLIIVAFVWLL